MSELQLHLDDDILATIDAFAKSRGFNAAYLLQEEARLLAEKARFRLEMKKEYAYREKPETRPHWSENMDDMYDRALSRAEDEAYDTIALLDLIDNTTADLGNYVLSREAIVRTISRQQRQFYKSCLFADLRVNQGHNDPKSHDFKMSTCCRLIAFGIPMKEGQYEI